MNVNWFIQYLIGIIMSLLGGLTAIFVTTTLTVFGGGFVMILGLIIIVNTIPTNKEGDNLSASSSPHVKMKSKH